MPLMPKPIDSVRADSLPSEDAEYYLATKIQSGYFRYRFAETVNSWQRDREKVKKSFTTYKSYDQKPLIAMKPDLKKFRAMDWEKVVLTRKSERHFDGGSIEFSELSNLLLLSFGLKDGDGWLKRPREVKLWPKRALPSGGGMYPLEAYVLALNVNGLAPGLYHLDLLRGGLSHLHSEPELFRMEEYWAQQSLFEKPAALIFITAIFNKSRVKYGPRALRYILLEAGGIGAHMNLTANAMGLSFCMDGGGFEDKIERMLGIDGRSEGLILNMNIGHVADRPDGV
jgi:SagB-type dehydrogenase family enzyme